MNIDAMRNVFLKIWRLKSVLTIKEAGERLFLFHFEDDLEKDRVFQKQPWSFNKSLLILKEFDGHTLPNTVNMDWCAFNVQIHGLPLDMMNEKIGVVLGESIGDVEEVECDANMVAWGRCLKVRVSINTSRALRRGKMLSVPGGGKVLAMYRYEHLPDFCYVCGRLDHLEQDCDDVVRSKKEGKKVHREYGQWLRAEGNTFTMSKEGVTESKSGGESFSSLPLEQKGVHKGMAKEKNAKTREINSEIRREVSDKGVQESSRWSKGRRCPMKNRPNDSGGKIVDSNPDNGGNQQPLPRKSSKANESNSCREVEELVGNLDMVVLCQNKSEIEGMVEETVNEGNLSSSNNSTRSKRLSTWKRSIRRYMNKKQAERVVSSE